MGSTSIAWSVALAVLPGSGIAYQDHGAAASANRLDQDVRGSFVGKVLRYDGKAAARATVTLVRVSPLTLTDLRILDFVQVQTDDRGIFKAQLQKGRVYSAWAITEISEERYRATRFYQHVMVGRPLAMREYESVRHRLRMRLIGRKVWEKSGALRFSVQYPSASGSWQQVQLSDEGIVTLPALPGDGAAIRVFNQDGHQLLGPDQLYQDLGKPGRKSLDLKLGQPYPLAIKVRKSTGSRQPIVGARLYATGWNFTRVLIAETNKEGVAYFHYPACRWEMFDLSLHYVVQAKGYGEVRGTVILMDFDDTRTMQDLRSSGKLDDEIIMMKGHLLEGRVWLSKGRPARNVTVRLDAAVPLSPDIISEGSPILTRTDQDGRFSFASRNNSFAYRLSCLIDPSQLSSRPVDTDYPLQSLIVLTQDVKGSSKDSRLDDFYLDRMRILRVEVRTADGRPAESPALYLADAQGAFGKKRSVPGGTLYFGNARGRLSLLLPNTFDRGLLVAVSPESSGATLLPRVLPETPWEIQLQPSTTISGRVVDEEGKPIAGVQLNLSPQRQSGDFPIFDYPWTLQPHITKPDGTFELKARAQRTYILYAQPTPRQSSPRQSSMTEIHVLEAPITNLQIKLTSPH